MILSTPFIDYKIKIELPEIGIGILWLFTFSGILGIELGYADWFIQQTPLNLGVQIGVLLWLSNIRQLKDFLTLFGVIVLGMSIEIIGVKTAWPFGNYTYGDTLGPKLLEVPILIGLNWAFLSWAAYSVVNQLKAHWLLKALIASAILVLIDIPLEIIAPQFNFWNFLSEAPLNNYIAWGVTAFLMQLIIKQSGAEVNPKVAANLLISQVLFFSYFAFL